MNKVIMLLAICFSAVIGKAEVSVSNVLINQSPGTKHVVISYDVNSTQTNIVTVWLTVSNGTEEVAVQHVTGDVGQNITTGSGKTIIWDMGQDWSKTNASLEFAIGVDDRIRDTPIPSGGDPIAISWEIVNDRWVKNIYANGDITMSDRLTNKMWLYNANPCDQKTWYQAKDYCESLTYAWYSDWILPDRDTLVEQHSQRSYFINVSDYYYWSSTLNPPGGTTKAECVRSYYYWYIGTYRVETQFYILGSYAHWVWPVRNIQ